MPAADADLDPPAVEAWLTRATGRLAFDIGANHGRVARKLARGFDRVVAFEPCAESYVKLAEAAENDLVNLEVEQVAVTDLDRPIVLTEQEQHLAQGQLTSPDEAGPEWSGLVQGSWGKVVGRRGVTGHRLDTIVASGTGVPDLVKVDTEGHELRVVRGGMELFREHRPRFYIEVHHDQLGQGIRELLDPLYPDLTRLAHPGYGPDEFGHGNHYWLVSDGG